MSKKLVTAANLDQLITNEVRSSPHCAGFKSVSTRRVAISTVGSAYNWVLSVVNYGEASALECDEALRAILPRMQYEYDLVD